MPARPKNTGTQGLNTTIVIWNSQKQLAHYNAKDSSIRNTPWNKYRPVRCTCLTRVCTQGLRQHPGLLAWLDIGFFRGWI